MPIGDKSFTYNDFEELAFNIIALTDPLSLDWKQGGRDRGRDIVADYHYKSTRFTIIIECKYYSSAVGIREVSNAVNWAKVHRPDVLFFFIAPHLSPPTKDYLEDFSLHYGIAVDSVDQCNIELFEKAYLEGNPSPFQTLKQRILLLFDSVQENLDEIPHWNDLEYEAQILASDHLLVNRENEYEILLHGKSLAYFIHGVSGAGKTQLAKKIAEHYHSNKSRVFWHTILVEEDSDSQVRSFLLALSVFLGKGYSDKDLFHYFKEHGYGLTNQLLLLIKKSLSRNKPTIFIDDTHKCRASNELLIAIFQSIISERLCMIHFIGWYNIFTLNPSIKQNLVFVPVKGLKTASLAELIKKTYGKNPPKTIIDTLIQQYDGLPIYALHVSELKGQCKDEDCLQPPEYFFKNLLSRLNNKERDVLSVLSIARTPIALSVFNQNRMLEIVEQLSDKKIAQITGRFCRLHDTIREVARARFSGRALNDNVLQILQCAAKDNTGIWIDISNAYLQARESKRAFETIKNSFNDLLNNGFDLSLLELVQRLIEVGGNFLALNIMKLSLYERLGQYDKAIIFVDLIDSSVSTENELYNEWTYIKLRLKYFDCQYDEVAKNVLNMLVSSDGLSPTQKAQLLFLIGRICYIRGDSFQAAVCYFSALRQVAIHNRFLALKGVHRLAMIEAALGLNNVALKTFERISQFNNAATKKRRSFIQYRIAKCNLKLGRIDEAQKNNDSSIGIKQSFNHSRGLVFSYKLNAQINRKTNVESALLWAEQAFNLAKNLSLPKERVSTGLVLARVLVDVKNYNDAREILSEIIPTVCKLRLYTRIKEIQTIVNSIPLDDDLTRKMQLELRNVEPKEVDNEMELFANRLFNDLSEREQRSITELVENKKGVTDGLLLLFENDS